MPKVQESTLAEIQQVPVLHDGSVPSVPAAFCAGKRRTAGAGNSFGAGRQDWRAAKLGN